MRWCCALVLVTIIVATPVAADPGDRVATAVEEPVARVDVVDAPAPKRVSRARRAVAIGLAIFPGVLVRGIGSWVVHERRAARKLLLGTGIGLAIGGAAGALVGASGANPYTMPAAPLVFASSGVFLTSWISDIWIAAGGRDVEARPRATAPWSIEIGTTWQHDAYRERALLRGGGRVELGRVGLSASGLLDAGGDAKGGYADVRVRLLGAPATGEVVDDGSRLLIRVGTRVERDDDDRVTMTTAELELLGRLDLDRIEPAFGPTFAELSIGIGGARIKYSLDRHELESLLLGTFAWGAYLGERAELSLFYDHRRDGLAGGIAAWRAAGFIGSVGARVDLRVQGPWALRGELEIGNAWISTLALGYRGGPR